MHTKSLDTLRLQHGAEHLHRCGARALAEFLAELSGRAGGMPATMALLNEYQQRLDPRLLRAAGGDRVSRRQLAAVPR
ncbi:hypothetical protein GCM10011504_47760 [Siccirubricoccus deserti]|nr:hypothetical protein GCM10011504_47760 [Siccirubricoccus deserti]